MESAEEGDGVCRDELGARRCRTSGCVGGVRTMSAANCASIYPIIGPFATCMCCLQV